MPTVTHTFEDGSTESLTTPDATSSYVPLYVIDEYRPPKSHRKRPKGPSMTPYHIKRNTYRTYNAYFDKIVFKDVFRARQGWHYTRRCNGRADPPSPYYSFSNTERKSGLLGSGGFGAQWLYLEAKRLKVNQRVYQNVNTIPGVRHYPLVSSDNSPDNGLSDVIAELQRKVVADTLEAYDAGTEFAERTKTIQTIYDILRSCVSPIRAIRQMLRDLEKPGTTLASLVLQYEYAIRPLLYSMESISKIAKDYAKMTIRKTRTKSISFTTDARRPMSESCTFEQGTVIYKIRACSYLHFDTELERVTSSIRINPLLTAWELIPFSFVLDWFVGVGDWLINQTASLSQNGANALFCVSVRKIGSFDLISVIDGLTIPENVFHHDYTDSWSNNTCFQQGAPVVGSGLVTVSRTVRLPKETYAGYYATLSSSTFNEYTRSLFSPSDVPIELNSIFDLSKRRLLDAVSLLSVQLKR